MLARHRLGLLYEHGVQAKQPGTDKITQVIPRDCEKATVHYMNTVETSSPFKARRMRQGYKYYMDGNLDQAVRQYLIAAETGSDLALMNAAFLLEEGACPGLSSVDCAKAAARLWKAAADHGHSEASLRVGDFYYYGKFRESKTLDPLMYLGFPERAVMDLAHYVVQWWMQRMKEPGEEPEQSCSADQTCPAAYPVHSHTVEEDLSKAAEYYRMAAERNASPRAHFNLGFLYEWGLGLKQDFPLAKRHYDLAITTSSLEAEVPVSLALMALNAHEYIVKKYMAWEDWIKEQKQVNERGPRTRKEVLMKHLLSFDSAVILVIILVIPKLLMMMQNR